MAGRIQLQQLFARVEARWLAIQAPGFFDVSGQILSNHAPFHYAVEHCLKCAQLFSDRRRLYFAAPAQFVVVDEFRFSSIQSKSRYSCRLSSV